MKNTTLYRYYSTQRPVSLGTYPTYGAKEIHNFDEKTYCPEISRSAWGYIDYNRILSKAEIESYELVYSVQGQKGAKLND